MAKNTPPLKKDQKEKIVPASYLQQINPHAAGIDIGSKSHFVAVRTSSGEINIKEFSAFTPDLYALAQHLKEHRVTTVAMESIGVYWLPLYEILEEKRFEVKLVNARHVKNVTGRKDDVKDCQWLKPLAILPLRAYNRQRSMLIAQMTTHIQHMQKALFQMNLHLTNVLSDITGLTGMKIIRSILAGERNPEILAQMRNPRCAKSKAEIEKSLTGNWREEHLFSLQQALELYDFYQKQILKCDEKIESALQVLNEGHIQMPRTQTSQEKKPRSYKKEGNALYFDVSAYLKCLTGVDLTKIPGIGGNTALMLLGEIGLDMSQWKTVRHFTSWLGLSPENKISGGKRLSSKTKPMSSRAAQILRIAASTLYRSDSALGGFLKRLKSRIGAPKAITATARKLAILIYSMLKNGTEYVEVGLDYYERQYKERLIHGIKKRAAQLGYTLAPLPEDLCTT